MIKKLEFIIEITIIIIRKVNKIIIHNNLQVDDKIKTIFVLISILIKLYAKSNMLTVKIIVSYNLT